MGIIQTHQAGGVRRIILCSLKLGVIFGLLIFWYANAVILSRRSAIADTPREIPTSTYGLIFGGGLKPDGTMSEMQEDRVRQGIELYRSGKVRRLILTGDDGARRQDEISAMRQYALDSGLSEADLIIDPHGYRTIASCERTARVYEVTSTIAVSQSFHLSRIIYLCEHFGIATIGVSSDLRDYHSWWIPYGREPLARFKAWVEVEFNF